MATGKEEANTSSEPSSYPRLQLTVRGKTGTFGYYSGEETEKDERFKTSSRDHLVFSPDGSIVLTITEEGVLLQNAANGETIQLLNRPKITAVHFSPKGSFLLTWERPVQTQQGQQADNNLLLWRVSTGEVVHSWFQKAHLSELWPTVQWSSEETVFGRAVSSEVHLWSVGELGSNKVTHILKVPGVTQFSIAPGPAPITIATFVKEKGSNPATIKLWRYPIMSCTATKSIFNAQEVDWLWNNNGSALLVATHTDVDKTGKSYYGTTSLHYLQTDGKFSNTLELKKEGPIADVAWSPNGKGFAVTYGYMPAQTTIFDTKCVPVADLGTGSRNTLRWSPNARLLCVGGFGNLQGQMDVWDHRKLKKVGSINANCSAIQEWSPDSRYIVTAVVAPRVRVDNGFKVWKYDGTLMYEESSEELYQVSWRPVSSGLYPDRPPSPRTYANHKEVEQQEQAKSTQYVPPHMRGRVQAAPAIKKESDGPVKYNKSGNPTGAAAAQRAKDLPVGADPDEKPEKKKPKPKASAPAPVKAPVKAAAPVDDDPQKKIKLINKKLMQIKDIKKLQESGAELDASQLAKLDTEEQLNQELKQLSLF